MNFKYLPNEIVEFPHGWHEMNSKHFTCRDLFLKFVAFYLKSQLVLQIITNSSKNKEVFLIHVSPFDRHLPRLPYLCTPSPPPHLTGLIWVLGDRSATQTPSSQKTDRSSILQARSYLHNVLTEFCEIFKIGIQHN